MTDVDVRFQCMGTTMRIVAYDRERIEQARAYLLGFDRRLSRFRPDSELSRLNADPRETVPASALLRAAIRAGLWAAEATGGLVDPTLVGALEAAGYTSSMAGAQSQPLGAVLEAAPTRRAAAPDPRAGWRQVEVDDAAGVIHRPSGLRLDNGGTGKGLAADAAALLLDGDDRFVVDCGGDLRVGGPGARRQPFEVDVAHPLTGRVAHTFPLAGGGRGHVGDRPPGLAPGRRQPRTPPDRSLHRAPGLDRPGRRDRGRALGPRGRRPRQGRGARGPGGWQGALADPRRDPLPRGRPDRARRARTAPECAACVHGAGVTPGVLIAGGGLAAQRCSEALRKAGYEGAIRVVCGESRAPYDRPPLSKAVLAGTLPVAEVALRPAAWYVEHGVELLLGRRADSVDPAAHELVLDDGTVAPTSTCWWPPARSRGAWSSSRADPTSTTCAPPATPCGCTRCSAPALGSW